MFSRAALPFALVAALSAITSVQAHGYVYQLDIGNVSWSGYLPYTDPYEDPVPERIVRKIPGNGPVENVSISDIQCNTGAEPAALVASAKLGDEIAMHWTAWPTSHKGPVITYMARTPDGTNITDWMPDTDSVWFKVDEAGYEDDEWAAVDIMADKQNSTWYWTIPSDLVAGQYLVRHEIIALHSAETYPGAQFYPMCFQIQIDDGGDLEAETSDLVAFPGAYQGSDPGITIDIYETITNYTIPGPELWAGADSNNATELEGTASSFVPSVTTTGGSSDSGSGSSSAAAATSVVSSSAAVATSAAAATSAGAATSAVATSAVAATSVAVSSAAGDTATSAVSSAASLETTSSQALAASVTSASSVASSTSSSSAMICVPINKKRETVVESYADSARRDGKFGRLL